MSAPPVPAGTFVSEEEQPTPPQWRGLAIVVTLVAAGGLFWVLRRRRTGPPHEED